MFLADIWPSSAEIQDFIAKNVTRDIFASKYADVFKGDDNWRAVQAPSGQTYAWDDQSTYVQDPPYFEGMGKRPGKIADIKGARILGLFGDKITTDHISPAGSIKAASPAGEYLMEHGVGVADFNQYGTRRGNHEVMMRGTFANIRIRNHMLGENGREGGYTIHYPSKEEMSIYDAAMEYKKEGVPLVIFAGVEYGNGSSRDWAAKGTNLLGVRAVIAEVVRAHPPLQPGRHGRHPLRARGRRHLGLAGAQGRRDGHHRGAGCDPPAPEDDGAYRLCRRLDEGRADPLPHRYRGRARVLQERRHSAVRAAGSGGVGRKRALSKAETKIPGGNAGAYEECVDLPFLPLKADV